MFEKRKLLVIVWMHEYVKGMQILGDARVAPIDLQSVGVANPSIKEPARVAFTTIAVIVQSIAQSETSNVDHDDGISKI